MNTLNKGALAMVFVGSVTFSVTNGLLGDQSPIQLLVEEHSLSISGDLKKVDVTGQTEKKVKEQTPTTNVKADKTEPSYDIPASQAAFNNKDKSDMATAANQQNTKKYSKSTTTNPASTNETTTNSTAPTTSAKAPTTTPTSTRTNTTSATTNPAAPTKVDTSAKAPTTAPTSTGTNPTSATTTTTNRGQEVSQAAKEKATSQRDSKENSGKKK